MSYVHSYDRYDVNPSQSSFFHWVKIGPMASDRTLETGVVIASLADILTVRLFDVIATTAATERGRGSAAFPPKFERTKRNEMK